MFSYIKDRTKILSDDKNENNRNFTLITGTKLDEVFTQLPSGIFNKTETGIGATTLELRAKRNSIIVEPVKITASSKAMLYPGSLYVGSPTKSHPNKVTDNEIRDYLKNSLVSDKKIIVVADSLRRIIFLLNAQLDDFFLMIDEADAFQMDSGYRKSMETCLDIYKTFPKHMRALVTATMLPFSDPELEQEHKTCIRYERATKRTIHVAYADNLEGAAVDTILKLMVKFPSDKVMIAYNSVNGCHNIAQHLTEHHKIDKNKIRILCSENSKKMVGDYFHQLDADILPANINLVTSAYFSGFDLLERYHLISISSNRDKIYASLSEHKLKQIAGRCRKLLFSETIIYDINPVAKKIPPPIEALIIAAEKEVKALDCISANYLSNSVLKHNLEQIRDLIISNTKVEGYQLVRRNNHHEIAVSYFNIDAILESYRVQNELYNTRSSLPDFLISEKHIITVSNHVSKIEVASTDVAAVNRKQQVDDIIEQIRVLKIFEVKELFNLDQLQKSIVDAYLMHVLYADKDQLLQKLKDAANSRDSRAMTNTRWGILYCTLHPDSIYKRNVNQRLRIGEAYSPAELLVQWNKIFEETGMQKQLKSEVTATRISKLHFILIRRKGGHYIHSINPFIKVIKHRPGQEDIQNLTDMVFNIFSST